MSFFETHRAKIPLLSHSCVIVDTESLVYNWKLLQAKAAPAICSAVVKADAYGLGLVPIVKALWKAGCTHFFVAQLEEALLLRQTLADATIFVLHGSLEGAEHEFVRHRLHPVVNDLTQLKKWRLFADFMQRRLPIILHFDTGMSRLGISAEDGQQLLSHPELLNGLSIEYAMTHLACADDVDNSLTPLQYERFSEYIRQFPFVKVSICNSSAIFRGQHLHGDLVRPGAALYGLNPTPEAENPMKPVVHWYARVIQLKTLHVGMTVGYGATYTVKHEQRAAIIELGYADGFLRSLTTGSILYFNGAKLPVIGRISMDLLVLDVSQAHTISEGDFVEIVGEHQCVDDLALQAGTIGYEILTRMGPRSKHIYV